MTNPANKEFPASVAAGMQYFNELIKDEQWFQTHEGKHAAILNDSVAMVADNPEWVASDMRHTTEAILYIPHVVRLPDSDLPEEQAYFDFLMQDPRWRSAHRVYSLAIVGRQVVGTDISQTRLRWQVTKTYGEGIFIAEVAR